MVQMNVCQYRTGFRALIQVVVAEYSASAHPHHPVTRVRLCRVGRQMPQSVSFLASEYQDAHRYRPGTNRLCSMHLQRRQNAQSLQNGPHQLKYDVQMVLRHIFFAELLRFRRTCHLYIYQNQYFKD